MPFLDKTQNKQRKNPMDPQLWPTACTTACLLIASTMKSYNSLKRCKSRYINICICICLLYECTMEWLSKCLHVPGTRLRTKDTINNGLLNELFQLLRKMSTYYIDTLISYEECNLLDIKFFLELNFSQNLCTCWLNQN